MRNRKSYGGVPQEAKPQIVKPITKEVIVPVQDDEMKRILEKLVGKIGDMSPQDLSPLVDQVRNATKRPTKVAVEVVRDKDGKVVGMLAYTDQQNIDRIEAMRDSDDIEDWVESSLIQ